MNPPEVRFDPSSGRVAIRTALSAPRAWFVFDPNGGGHYADGTRSPDKVTDWPPHSQPETQPEEQDS